jgi:hypothetical protein
MWLAFITSKEGKLHLHTLEHKHLTCVFVILFLTHLEQVVCHLLRILREALQQLLEDLALHRQDAAQRKRLARERLRNVAQERHVTHAHAGLPDADDTGLAKLGDRELLHQSEE